eukprot:scaffold6410_cov64-Phaeocystis_antarctica.AAC.1
MVMGTISLNVNPLRVYAGGVFAQKTRLRYGARDVNTGRSIALTLRQHHMRKRCTSPTPVKAVQGNLPRVAVMLPSRSHRSGCGRAAATAPGILW